MLDEARFSPVNVWCPLQAMNEANGALKVLRGSHRLCRGPRAVSIPAPWQRHEALIAERMTPIHMPAGSAVLFKHATLHASDPNLSSEVRIAATMFLAHESASVQIAHRNPENASEIDIYSQEDDFLMRSAQFSTNTTGKPQIGTYVRSVPYEDVTVGEREIVALEA